MKYVVLTRNNSELKGRELPTCCAQIEVMSFIQSQQNFKFREVKLLDEMTIIIIITWPYSPT
jgi:hypothetical protein